MPLLDDSYEYCRRLTQQTAHNFRFSFMTLPGDKRRAMNALYAFNRITDDLGDDEKISIELRRTQLDAWRRSIRAAFEGADANAAHDPKTAEVGTLSSQPALLAITDMVARHKIPHDYLIAVIDGVEMDVHPKQIRTFDDLQDYCFHVAGAVGLCCIHVWGFSNEQQAKPLAIDCGLALQLTNILRDLSEDAEQGRIYLPKEDLDRFGYSVEDLRNRVINDRFRSLMKFQVERTKTYYQRAELLFQHLAPPGKPILRTMIDIYGGLLREIERRDFDVFSQRVSLAKWKKLWFAGRAIVLQKLRLA